MSNRDEDRLKRLATMEPLSTTLADRDGGEYFAADLAEARALAAEDPRFAPLAEGLAAASLGERMQAIDRFFASLPAQQLAGLQLPPHLAQLRQVYFSSRSD